MKITVTAKDLKKATDNTVKPGVWSTKCIVAVALRRALKKGASIYVSPWQATATFKVKKKLYKTRRWKLDPAARALIKKFDMALLAPFNFEEVTIALTPTK